MKPGSATPWLHIRGQFTFHGEAEIKGTRAGLVALQAAIVAALRDGVGSAAVLATDGEGYDVNVTRISTVAGLGSPSYVDETARGLASNEFKSLVIMHKLMRAQDREALEALKWCRANGNPHREVQP